MNTRVEKNQVDALLRETELGNLISRHKILVFSLAGILILGLLGYSFFSHLLSQNYSEYGNQLFHFSQNELKQFEEKKLETSALLKKYEEITAPMGDYPELAYQHLRIADLFIERKMLDEAQSLLEKGFKTFSSPQVRYFFATRLAVLHENKGEYAQAGEYLEGLLKTSTPFLEEKIYLDLGRLQLLQGDRVKAKMSFEWVTDRGSEKEWRRMAQLYLEELEKEADREGKGKF